MNRGPEAQNSLVPARKWEGGREKLEIGIKAAASASLSVPRGTRHQPDQLGFTFSSPLMRAVIIPILDSNQRKRKHKRSGQNTIGQ